MSESTRRRLLTLGATVTLAAGGCSPQTAARAPLPPPPHIVDVTITDYQFAYNPFIHAGRVVFSGHNVGLVPHTIRLFPIDDSTPRRRAAARHQTHLPSAFRGGHGSDLAGAMPSPWISSAANAISCWISTAGPTAPFTPSRAWIASSERDRRVPADSPRHTAVASIFIWRSPASSRQRSLRLLPSYP